MNINQFLQLLLTILEGSMLYSVTSRFLRDARRALMLFHRQECPYFHEKKEPSGTCTENLTLLNAFEIVRQLERSGLLIRHNTRDSIVAEQTSDHVFDLTCQVCFVKRATLAIPCGHIFQCVTCWAAFICSQHHDQPTTVDNIDLRQLQRATENANIITNVGFSRQRLCPVCRGWVISIQHIFI